MLKFSSSRRQSFLHLMVFYSLVMLFLSYSGSVLPPYLFEQGLTISQQITGKFLLFFSAIIILIIAPKISAIKSWRLALIIQLIYLFLIAYQPSLIKYYLATIISGGFMYFFFVFYNTAHFKLTPKGRTGLSSAIMFTIPTLISVIVPILAGLSASISYSIIWGISLLLFAISFWLTRFQKDFTLNIDLKQGIKGIKPTRAFVLIEGVWEVIFWGIIPIYTLFFISTPLQYGLYLSYLSLIGAITSLFLGKYTDRTQRRAIWLYPLTITLSLLTVALAFSTENSTYWFIVTGIMNAILPIFWKFSTAFFVDAATDMDQAFPAREFLLSVGRAAGFLIVVVCLSLDHQIAPILILGLFFLSFPILLYYRQYVTKSYKYL